MPPKKRGFDGCWTCRSKKIKCDTRKPFCTKCEKSGLKCEGYNVRLGWSDLLSTDPNGSLISVPIGDTEIGFHRRTIDLVNFPESMTYKRFDDIDKALEKLESISSNSSKMEYSVGPFMISRGFNSGASLREKDIENNVNDDNSIRSSCCESPPEISDFKDETQTNLSQLVASHIGSPNLPYHESGQAIPSLENHDYDKTKSTETLPIPVWIHPDLIKFAKLSIIALKGFDYKYDELDMIHILYPKFLPNDPTIVYVADKEPTTVKLYETINFKSQIQLLGTNASAPSLIIHPVFRILMSTFKENLRTFMVVTFKKNFWESNVLSLIYEIVGESISLGYIGLDWSNSTDIVKIVKNIIIYQVSCLSAFILSKSEKGSSQENEFYLKLSVELRSLALDGLKKILSWNPNLSVNEILLSIVLQIRIDNWFGVFENITYFFSSADELINNNIKNCEDSNLVQYFKVMRLFYDSTKSVDLTNYRIDENDENENYQDIKEDYNLLKKDVFEHDKNYYKKKIQIQTIISGGNPQKKHSNERDPDRAPPSFTISFRTDEDDHLDDENNISDDNEKIEHRKYEDEESSKAREVEEEEEEEEQAEPLDLLFAPTRSKSNAQEHPKFGLIDIPRPDDDFSTNPNVYSSINLMYGIPTSLADLFNRIIVITNHRNIFQRKGLFPRNFPKICADMEDSLINWKLDWSLYRIDASSLSNSKIFYSDFHKSLYHNILSFYYGVLIYFYRLIKDVTPRLLQLYVSETLNHITELKKSKWNINPLFWQFFITGCDATDESLQRKFETSFEEIYGRFNNFWRAKQIMFEVWKRRDEGQEDICWIDIVREWDIVLYLG